MEIFHLDVEVSRSIFLGQFSRVAHAIWVYADANHVGYYAVNQNSLKIVRKDFWIALPQTYFVKGEILGQLRSWNTLNSADDHDDRDETLVESARI